MKLNKKISITLLFIISVLGISSCSTDSDSKLKKIGGIYESTIYQQAEYHKNQIKKYRYSIVLEDQSIYKSLSSRDMNNVRRSNNRKMQYFKKIDYHLQEIEKLREK